MAKRVRVECPSCKREGKVTVREGGLLEQMTCACGFKGTLNSFMTTEQQADFHRNSYTNRILKAMKAVPGEEVTVDKMLTLLKESAESKKNVQVGLSQLYRQGWIERPRRGVYVTPAKNIMS